MVALFCASVSHGKSSLQAGSKETLTISTRFLTLGLAE
jgi:hypothetical protein